MSAAERARIQEEMTNPQKYVDSKETSLDKKPVGIANTAYVISEDDVCSTSTVAEVALSSGKTAARIEWKLH